MKDSKKEWYLLSKRYSPTKKGESYKIEGDENEHRIIFSRKTMTGELFKKVNDIFSNGDAYSVDVIETEMYNAMIEDFNIAYHLAQLNKLTKDQILSLWIKSINNKFDKDKDYII